MANKIQIAAGLKVLINGQDWGITTSVSWIMATPRDEERGIDSLAPFELSPTMTSARGTIGLFMLRNDPGLEGRNATGGMRQDLLSTERYFGFQLIDRATGFVVVAAEDCAVENQQWQVAARGIVTGQFSFTGLILNTGFTKV